MYYSISTFTKRECTQQIFWSIQKTKFGPAIIASLQNRICFVGFTQSIESADFTKRFPHCTAVHKEQVLHLQMVQSIIHGTPYHPLCLVGTSFQHQVWQALLQVKQGTTCTYTDAAKAIHRPNAVRAVATAIGANPIAYIIPCHRVLPATGKVGNYHWGTTLKALLLQSE